MGIWKCWFLRRGENWSTQRKTSQSKGENQQQTQPTYGADAGIWSRAALVGGERSHHCTIPCSLTYFFGFEGKFSAVSPRDVQPTFLYSRRGFEFPCTSEHRQTKLYTYSFWLRREIQNNIKINLDHSKQWVCMTFHFLCEMGCLCIYVYLEFS